jgi:ribokinase
MNKIVVIGSSNTDLVTYGPVLPMPGQTVLHESFMRSAGGKGANQAVAAARAGGAVTFVGAVGEDDFGRAAGEALASEGIDISFLQRKSETPSGVALIMVDFDGENQIAVAPGANGQLTAEDVDAAADAIRSADVVLASLEVPLEAVVRGAELAAEAERRFILNPAPAPRSPLPDDLLQHVTYMTPNESEFAAAMGLGESEGSHRQWHETVMRLLRKGPQALILTLSSRGVTVFTVGGARNQSAFAVDAVDTVGAGDALNGALAVALAEGRELEAAVDFAQAAAALSVTRQGSQPSLPRRDEIDQFVAGGPLRRISGRLPQGKA